MSTKSALEKEKHQNQHLTEGVREPRGPTILTEVFTDQLKIWKEVVTCSWSVLLTVELSAEVTIRRTFPL